MWHEDVATRARFLIDQGFITRQTGFYCSGETYPVE
jgi:hypothetical protein